MTPPHAPLAALLILLHGDDARMEHVYFWSAILIVVTPLIVFGGIGAWLYRMWSRSGKPE